MQDIENILNVSVAWRGNKYIVGMRSNASLKDLGDELKNLTNVKADTMRFIVPRLAKKGSNMLYPFSDEHSQLNLQEAAIIEGRSIIMMGVSEDEVDKVLQNAKVNQRIAGFDEEEKRMRQRISDRPHALVKLPQGPYIFCDFRTLEIPGIELNPPASEALKRMHRLAADPGIVAIMNKHRWHVGIMTEMAPVGYVGISPKCILGFNKNCGEEISLRLRTDDLKGFRKYESIKKTLLHELAHMVFSEHDANFYALDKQLNQEAASLDWTKSRGHTLNGARHLDYYEDDFDAADYRSSSQKLGGNALDQLASARASSVAAAYRRLANASATISEESEVHQELDIDDSQFSLHDKPDNIDCIENFDHGPDLDGHSFGENKCELDPNDSQGNHSQMMGILNSRIQLSNTIDEPDPDDLEVKHSNLGDRNIEKAVQNDSQVTKGNENQAYLSKAYEEPDPDDSQANGFKAYEKPNPEESQPNRVMWAEPDPDESQPNRVMWAEPDPDESQPNRVMWAEPDPDESQPNRVMWAEPDPDESQANRGMKAEPDPDDSIVPSQDISNMQIDESNSDDQELLRIQDPVTIICGRLHKAIEMLRAEVNSTEATASLQTLIKIIRNMIEHPNEMKFKRLRKANPTIQKNLVDHKAAMEILQMVGFSEDVVFNENGKTETYLVLRRNDPGLLWLAKSSLESSMAH